MSDNYLDCSAEVSEIRQPSSDRLVWLASDIGSDDYLVTLDDAAIAEIERLAQFFTDNPLPLLQRKLEDLDLPACRALMAQMKSILDEGVGFAVLDRLPVDDYPIETLLEVYLGARSVHWSPGGTEMEWRDDL